MSTPPTSPSGPAGPDPVTLSGAVSLPINGPASGSKQAGLGGSGIGSIGSERVFELATWTCAVASFVFCAMIIVLAEYPPCGDAAAHLLSVVVTMHPERFEGQLVPQVAWTGQSFVQLTYLVAQVFPLMVAYRVVMMFGLVFHVLGLWSVARRFEANGAIAVSLGALGFVGWSYAMGFFSFSLATTFGTCAWAAWTRRREHPAAPAICAVLLLAASWSHSIAGAMAIANLVLFEVMFGRGRDVRLRDVLILIPGIIWTLGTSAIALQQYETIGAVDAMPSHWLEWRDALAMATLAGLGSYSKLAAVVAVVAFVGAAQVAVRRVETLAERSRRASARASLVWLTGFFVLPLHGLGWFYAAPRALYFASSATPSVAFGRSTGFALALTAAAALSAAHALPRALSESARVEAVASRYPAANTGRAFGVLYHPEAQSPVTPYANPMGGTPAYAFFGGGGTAPGLFAFPSLKHSIRFARPSAEMFPNTARMLWVVTRECLLDPVCAANDVWRADRIASYAVRWDTVVLAGAPASFVDRLVARGFAPTDASALVLRARPSSLEVAVPSATIPDGVPVVFRAGYLDTIGWFRGGTIENLEARDETFSLRFDALPSGPVTIEIFADVDRDGELGPQDIALISRRTVEIRSGVQHTLPTE